MLKTIFVSGLFLILAVLPFSASKVSAATHQPAKNEIAFVNWNINIGGGYYGPYCGPYGGPYGFYGPYGCYPPPCPYFYGPYARPYPYWYW